MIKVQRAATSEIHMRPGIQAEAEIQPQIQPQSSQNPNKIKPNQAKANRNQAKTKPNLAKRFRYRSLRASGAPFHRWERQLCKKSTRDVGHAHVVTGRDTEFLGFPRTS